MKPLVYERPRARRDVVEHFRYLEHESAATAERFRDALEATYRDLVKFPHAGHIYEAHDPALAAVRIAHVIGFPSHLVFYRATAERIEVLAVMHGGLDIEATLTD